MATFTGTSGDDIITPSAVSPGVLRNPAGSFPGNGGDTIRGGAGDDSLAGGGGNDTIYGGADNDTIYGGSGNDYLHGSAESSTDYSIDVLYAGAGHDTLVGGGAGTEMVGGAGNDTYIFQSIFDYTAEFGSGGIDTIVLRVDLTDFGGDALRLDDNVENLTLAQGVAIASGRGNDLDNVITGNSGANALFGFDGDDELRGGGGSDTLGGGEGADTLRGQDGNDFITGGNGVDVRIGGRNNDTFAFGKLLNPGGPNEVDILRAGDGGAAFDGAGNGVGDVIDLSEVDANVTLGGDQAFQFGGASGGNQKGFLYVLNVGSDTYVRGNTDNDAAFELQIEIEDGAVTASAYRAIDFIL